MNIKRRESPIRRFTIIGCVMLSYFAGLLDRDALRAQSSQGEIVVDSQEVSFPLGYYAILSFIEGDFLQAHAIGNGHEITYKLEHGAAAMTASKTVDLPPETQVLSVSTDGRKAILGIGDSNSQQRLALLDVASGRFEDIPPRWCVSGQYPPDAELSADGHLISIYSESEGGMVVTVYNWLTKTLVTKRTSDYTSAGGIFGGGVTPDGEVEFDNNRSGREVVNLKTGALIGAFGWSSVRSANGAWDIEFPNRTFNESASRNVLVKQGMTGKTVGRLDVTLSNDELYGQVNGVFCGVSGRFVLVSGSGIGLYSIPSGTLLARFQATSHPDANTEPKDSTVVACSQTGRRVAVLSGKRLILYDLR